MSLEEVFDLTEDTEEALYGNPDGELPMPTKGTITIPVERIFHNPPGGDGAYLICPVCGFEYTHVSEVFTKVGGDEGGIYKGTVAKGTTPERRSALVIAFECENGHLFELEIQQHKGINFVGVS